MATVMHGGRLFGHRALAPANRRYARVVARERAHDAVGARDVVGAIVFAAASFGILVTLGAPIWMAIFTAVVVGFAMACTPRYATLDNETRQSL